MLLSLFARSRPVHAGGVLTRHHSSKAHRRSPAIPRAFTQVGFCPVRSQALAGSPADSDPGAGRAESAFVGRYRAMSPARARPATSAGSGGQPVWCDW